MSFDIWLFKIFNTIKFAVTSVIAECMLSALEFYGCKNLLTRKVTINKVMWNNHRMSDFEKVVSTFGVPKAYYAQCDAFVRHAAFMIATLNAESHPLGVLHRKLFIVAHTL